MIYYLSQKASPWLIKEGVASWPTNEKHRLFNSEVILSKLPIIWAKMGQEPYLEIWANVSQELYLELAGEK